SAGDGGSAVKTQSNANGAASRPVVGGESSLRRDRGSVGSWSTGACGEKRVAFSSHFGAAGPGKSLPDDQLVLFPDGSVTIPQVPEQLGRAFDVGEQERDGASRELGHLLISSELPHT